MIQKLSDRIKSYDVRTAISPLNGQPYRILLSDHLFLKPKLEEVWWYSRIWDITTLCKTRSKLQASIRAPFTRFSCPWQWQRT